MPTRTPKRHDALACGAVARRNTKRLLATVTDESLEKEVVRERKDGTKRILNGRWIYYHVLEHFAGHYGQILLLKHLRSDAVKHA